MEPSGFDEVAFFSAIDRSGVRALLIGRRALVLLGLPLLTADYDFWIDIDQIEAFNQALAPFDLHPTVSAEAARRRGRYVLENDEHVDVLVARSVTTIESVVVEFDALWSRREAATVGGATVWRPSVDDLILTKQVGARPKDAEDIRLLRVLKGQP